MADQNSVQSSIDAIRSDAQSAASRSAGYASIAVNIPRISVSGGQNNVPLGGGNGYYPVDLSLYDPQKPNVNVPLFSPDIDLGELMDLASENGIIFFTQKLSDEFTKFVNSWFPDYGVNIDTLQARLNEMLAGGHMLPVAIENAIFERGRSRIAKDYLALTQTVSSEMAGRGFTLPNGVMVARLDEAKFAGHAAVAGFSRDVAIRQAEIAVENLKFAMQMAYDHRKDAINAAIQYVGSILTTILDRGIQKAQLIVDAKRALWDASTRYYATLIDNGRLLLSYEELLENRSIEIARVMADVAKHDTARFTDGATAAASAMANVAGSALSSLNTISNLTHETIAGA